MITALVFVALTGVSLTAPDPVAETPDSVPATVDVQVNVVPPTDAVGIKLSGVLLHMS